MGGTQALTALSENADFFRERLNLMMLLGAASRVDRSVLKLFTFWCKFNEAQPGLVQSPALFSKKISYLTSPINFERAFLWLYCDGDPSKCSDLGMHNIGGHYQAGTAVRCITHFRQCYEAKRFQ